MSNEIVPVNNQAVPVRAIVTVARSPIDIWKCGPIGWAVAFLIIVFIVTNLFAFDLIDLPGTTQPPATNYQQQSTKIELAKIKASRDISIARSAAIGQWGRALIPAGFIALLLIGLAIIIRQQTIAEQKLLSQTEED